MYNGGVGPVLAIECRSRGPWFESYTGLTWISALWAQEMNLRGSTRPRREIVH